MREDLINDRGLPDDGDAPHGATTLGADQRVDLDDLPQELRPPARRASAGASGRAGTIGTAVPVSGMGVRTRARNSSGSTVSYEYGRTQTPTREAPERNVASLEGADFGFAFA